MSASMTIRDKTIYAKLLLFGEYSIIKGSAALAIPFRKYSGKWRFSSTPTASNKALRVWSAYLRRQLLSVEVHFDRFERALDDGLYFDADIPQGYGTGSSGAVCAAFLYEFVTISEEKQNDLFFLRKVSKELEFYFHGGGSGIDPMVCYYNQPLIFKPNNQIEIADFQIDGQEHHSNYCFLIDTQTTRKTQPLVQIFLEKCKDKNFENILSNELAPATDKAIQAIQTARLSLFLQNIRIISTIQFQHFKEMIPANYQSIWKSGLDDDLYKLKLCGAGGGGFILGFTRDWVATQAHLRGYEPQLVFTF